MAARRTVTPGQGVLFWAEPPAAARLALAGPPDLAYYDVLLASISGGKDSQTMLRVLVEAADAAGVRDRIVCVFADLGEDEWPGAAEIAALHAECYGLRFITVHREVTDPQTRQRRQQGLLEHIWHRGFWPDGRNRFCTSDLKRGPIRTVMTALTAELRGAGVVTGRRVRILNVMGMRAQESVTRRLMAPFGPDADASNLTRREVDEWLPVHALTTEEVWASILGSGVPHHYAYDLGMPRLSCMFCPLASRSALVLSARANPAAAARRVAVETEFVRRRAVATLAIAAAAVTAGRPGPLLGRGLRYTWRSGPWFKRTLSMAQISAEAAAAGPLPPRPGRAQGGTALAAGPLDGAPAEDWTD